MSDVLTEERKKGEPGRQEPVSRRQFLLISCSDIGGGMRKLENAEDRKRRLTRAAAAKKDDAAANDAAVDRMIRQNIEKNGP